MRTPSVLRAVFAIAGGAGLSFAAVGVLWVGTPWPFQFAMALPFFLFTYGLVRTDPPGQDTALLVAAGAAPLGMLFTKFRDPSGSHLLPVLMVLAWGAGIAGAWFLARRARAAPPPPQP